ncbi:MAG: tRNA (adenosine(37)-N6)-threonylcarbamoyltransferase complex transferase subunit TsaD [Kiritimatiellae bacterium]|nr:tRNA (adenosine(37)-N6)-threonylcarbamoyltransferase complex transferase subunit TsaD [Kiritimatiellia bacterium]MDD4735317.1 tRNA (adenosine(37)-N6)-threonylcarbamoyltransferase complex transferase subunit TsaD [Kiritimatiellia bacterium]
MMILGIETSCDETSAAVVEDGRRVLSCVIHSQIAQHRPYGGVVPEIASRAHVEVLAPLLDETLRQAGVAWTHLDAVAATYGPGLASSLLVGFSAARALALRLDRPLIPVNHLQAHLYAPFLGEEAPRVEDFLPAVSLLVSGGHTCLVEMREVHGYRLLGQTIDDAAGEALDKGASLLGLGYPGGPVIEKTAEGARTDFVAFPRGQVSQVNGSVDPQLCFSFSGVKTSLKYYVQQHPELFEDGTLADVTASYQEAVLDALASRFEKALRKHRARFATCGGGVVCNRRLRGKLAAAAQRCDCAFHLAEPKFCADNAAMVAGLAACSPAKEPADALRLDIHPNLPIGSFS